MSVNLMYGRTDPFATLAQIDKVNPDVVVFQEWTTAAEKGLLSALNARFPHRALTTRDDAYGQAIFSKLPFVEPVRTYPPRRDQTSHTWSVPQMRAVVHIAGDPALPVVLYNVHLLPPVGLEYIKEQRAQAAALATLADEETMAGNRVILAGDWNATPGTAHLDAIETKGYRAAFGRALGRCATWPRTGRLRHVPGIQLDHVYYGGASSGRRLMADDGGACDDIGSDHRPVWARFVALPASGGGAP